MRRVIQYFPFIILVFCVLVFRNHPSSTGEELYPLLPMPDISEMKSIMVFAPHPDDETLACGGLIAEARSRNIPVTVVVVTNGESFSYAAHIHYKKIILPPSYYIKFGEKRQKETLSAMKLLGVSSNDVIFLGYPDSDLRLLWESYWGFNQLYTHTLLRTRFSPFQNIYRKNAPYCGASLLEDIKELLIKHRPDYVFIPSAEDAHPTHWAVNCFCVMALEELKEQRGYSPKIFTYLVHRGRFPYPRAINLREVIKPPSSLLGIGIHWRTLPLSQSIVELKYEAIKQYKSQLLPRMKLFMFSFARQNELFAEEKEAVHLPFVNKGRIKIDGKIEDWTGIPPFIIDPQKDTLIHRLEPSADIAYIYACQDEDNLYLMLKLSGKPSREVKCYFNILGVEEKGDERLRLKKEVRAGKNYEGLEIAIPLPTLKDNKLLFIGATTNYGTITVDKSAYRVAILKNTLHKLVHHSGKKNVHSHLLNINLHRF
ncbi:PIG-L family deacetylase [bacterium]|nr:PIG-L family deacetylase [bacterium]